MIKVEPFIRMVEAKQVLRRAVRSRPVREENPS
jgi:hypothetical protein